MLQLLLVLEGGCLRLVSEDSSGRVDPASLLVGLLACLRVGVVFGVEWRLPLLGSWP